ncbi:MAG: hypothetical protein NTV62_03580 [Candidatus Gribaldobacteria bacterium]|nr:hypothetical protein [Candidatus Gribaldobacteria bacterium]
MILSKINLMLLKIKIIFSVLAVLFLLISPGVSLAWESYVINECPWIGGDGLFAKAKTLDTTKCTPKVVCYEGMVPCGKPLTYVASRATPASPEQCKTAATYGAQIMVYCTFCHAFLMINSIINFILLRLVPPVTVLMIVIGGVMFFLGGASANMVQKGKTLMRNVMIGIFLIYGAYILVGSVLAIFGKASNNPLSKVFTNGVFSITCPINVPDKPAWQ